MKAAYVGIDLLAAALPALESTGCEILRIFTCETDNVTEFNTQVCAFARSRGLPLQKTRMTAADLAALRDEGCELLLCGGSCPGGNEHQLRHAGGGRGHRRRGDHGGR